MSLDVVRSCINYDDDHLTDTDYNEGTWTENDDKLLFYLLVTCGLPETQIAIEMDRPTYDVHRRIMHLRALNFPDTAKHVS